MECFPYSFCTFIPFKLYLKPAFYLAQDTHTRARTQKTFMEG